MPDPKTAEFRFGLTGLTTKVDSHLLGDGSYRSLTNMEVFQEGSISTRNGRKIISSSSMIGANAYKIQKPRVFSGENPSTPSLNPRYVAISFLGQQGLYITYDYITFTEVAPNINTPGNYLSLRFQLADYSSGASGSAWAFIASELAMLKDRGNTSLVPAVYSEPPGLPRWGILPALGFAILAGAGAGNLDGGDSASPNGSTAYDYRYTYVAQDTGNEGNPSQVLVDSFFLSGGTGSSAIAGHLIQVSVTVWGTDDPQVAIIKIYRRGGLLFDNWRLVGQIPNPGFVGGIGGFQPAQGFFTDNIADADLVYADILEVDNDPPIVSAAPSPLTGNLAIPVTRELLASGFLPAGFSTVLPGSTVHIIDPAYPEDVVVFLVG
jgi:hypothetical protein